MSKVSKKLTNVIIVEGEERKGELLKYIEEIKSRNIPLISVQFPKDVEKFSTTFVNNNWNVNKMKVEDVVFFAKCASGKYMFAFSNEKFLYRLKRTIEKMHLDAEYCHLQEQNQKGVIVREKYENGTVVDMKISAKFNANKYSIAKCFV